MFSIPSQIEKTNSGDTHYRRTFWWNNITNQNITAISLKTYLVRKIATGNHDSSNWQVPHCFSSNSEQSNAQHYNATLNIKSIEPIQLLITIFIIVWWRRARYTLSLKVVMNLWTIQIKMFNTTVIDGTDSGYFHSSFPSWNEPHKPCKVTTKFIVIIIIWKYSKFTILSL